MASKQAWSRWPEPVEVQLPLLGNRPPFARNLGLEPADRAWKNQLLRRCLRGGITLPDVGATHPGRIRSAIHAVAHRCYHVARLVQTFFENPNHGNYADPFLEALFIILSWRTRIRDAKEIVTELIASSEGPSQLLEEDGSEGVAKIVQRVGFTGKRPEMIRKLISRFQEKFPDGNAHVMASEDDEQVIEFLISIPGIGRKSALCVLMYSLERERLPIDAHVGRVMRRTGLLKELYIENGEKDHRAYQSEAEEFVPPSTRRVLHTGLLSVGKDFCHPSRPDCEGCPIRRSCDYYRSRRVVLAQTRELTQVDLFCGAGGFSTGFAGEGFRTLLAVDASEVACDTFRMNHPDVPDGNVIIEDLQKTSPEEIVGKASHWKDALSPRQIDVLTAGIPCQGFSKAGYRSRPGVKYEPAKDPRNQLYESVIQWAKFLLPRYVVIENVPDIQSAVGREGRILEELRNGFGEIGYTARYETVNAFEFGLPQVRRRFILVASHRSMPAVSPDEFHDYRSDGGTVRTAIGDLPPVKANEGEWYSTFGSGVLTSHVARFHNEDDLEILEAILPGESYVSFVNRRRDIIERRRRNGRHAVYATRSFSDKFTKLELDKPSRTIVAHLQRDGNGYIHPKQVRSITPREAMRIQGFDDDSVVCGSRGTQFIQIGNAIPPPLARTIAKTLKRYLTGGESYSEPLLRVEA